MSFISRLGELCGFHHIGREFLSGNYYALLGAFRQEWRTVRRTSSYANFIISGIFNVVILAWFARQTSNPVAIAYLALGSSLMLIWFNSVFQIGWALSDERWNGLLDVSLVSRTPVIVAMLGKSLAISIFSMLSGSGAFIVVLLVSQHPLPLANLPFALVSLAVTMFVIICTGFIFCPITVLIGEPSGFFATVMPFGTACSGFLYPVNILPAALQVIARGLPTSWAMEAVIMSTTGSGSNWDIVIKLLVALALAVGYLFITQLLFRLVEWRVRVTSTLTTL